MKQKAEAQFRIGVDIGGTFTDIVFAGSDGTIINKKLLSTSDDYSRAVADGIKDVLIRRSIPGTAVKEVIHATTIVTNTCIELTGAKVGLITTQGFRDVLEIGRGRMAELYNLAWTKSPCLVPRYLRFEVDERIGKDGSVLKPLDIKGTITVIDALLAEKVQSVAICLFNSPRNPAHEEKIEELLQQKAPHLFISRSTKVRPMVKEYERTSETVVNAYVMPIVTRYLRQLRTSLDNIGIRAPLYVMQSSGGMITADEAADKPIEIVECGPAAGVVGGAYLATRQNIKNLITLDLGGTTTKASIVENGKYTRSDEYEVGAGIHRASRLHKGRGYVLRIPSIDIAEIGAGGGSIVWLDKGGLIQVGPRSSGASPGPACYNQGGEEPTLTDCYVVLGYMNPDYLLGGDFKLDAVKASQAFETMVAKPLGMGIIEAAYGAYLIANSNIRRAITSVSSERGRDPRMFSLVVFGGAGALHSVEVARGLGIKQVIIPPHGGLFSAFGLLCADIERNYVRTFDHLLDESTLSEMNLIFDGMIKDALASAQEHGYAQSTVLIDRYIDLRYQRQASEISIVVPAKGKLGKAHIPKLRQAFNEEHRKTFGHSFTHIPLEAINLRVSSTVHVPKPLVHRLIELTEKPKRKHGQNRIAYFGKEYGQVEVPVFTTEEIGTTRKEGPLLLDSYDTTIVVPPHCSIEAASDGCLLINVNNLGA